MTDAEKLGRIKARVLMIQEERRKPKRKRVVGLIGACLREIESMLSEAEAIYVLPGVMERRIAAPHEAVLIESGHGLDAIGSLSFVDLIRACGETDHDYRQRLIARLWEWKGPTHEGPTQAARVTTLPRYSSGCRRPLP